MKKIIIIFVCICVTLLFSYKVNASENLNYDNLFDPGKIAYDVQTKKFYSDQYIKLTKDKEYTFVVSCDFFGTNTNIEGNFFTTNCTDKSGNTIDLGFKFVKEAKIGIYYASYTPTVNCNFTITDLLVSGLNVFDLKLDEIIMYLGGPSDFKGFKKYVNLNGFTKAESIYNIFTSVDNLISMETINKNIRAYDANDGELSDITLVSSEYKEERILGKYPIVYNVKDSSDNLTTLTVNVYVEDTTKPVITGPGTIQWHCYDPWPSDEEIISHFSATDNFDGEISDRLYVHSSEKTGYIIGRTKRYIVNLGAIDSSGNEQRFVTFIEARDIKAPNLICEDIECGISTLYSDGIDSVLDKVVIECTDDAEIVSIEYVSQEFIDNNGFCGKYLVTVTAKDASGNTTVKEVYINIIDDIPPEFYIKTDLTTTTTNVSYTASDIKDLIEDKLDSDGILYDDICLISSNYFGNEKNTGVYDVKFMYKYQDTANYMVGSITIEPAPTPTYYFWFVGIGVVAILSVVVLVYRKKRSIV